MEQVYSQANVTSTASIGDRAFEPGWPDRFADWVSRLPVPGWAFYAGLGLAMLAVELLVKWLDGTGKPGTVLLFHAVLILSAPYALAGWHYIRETACKALEQFRPALNGGEAQYQSLRYYLRHAPARPTMLATIICSIAGTAVYALMIPMETATAVVKTPAGSLAEYLKPGISPLSTIIDFLFIAAYYAIVGAIMYRVFHVLRMVSRIYTQYTHVDIIKIGPLYALSGLTGRIAIIVLIATYGWYLTNPAAGASYSVWGLWLGFNIVGYVTVAILVFVWPLVGVHQILEGQKRNLLQVNTEEVRVAATETHRLLNAGEYADMVSLKNAMDSLAAERSAIQQMSTWPWQTETVRLVSSAVFLPLVVYGIEQVLVAVLRH